MIDEKYRQMQLSRHGFDQSIAVYANDKRANEVIVYITSGGFTCGMHMTPEQAREMARLLTLAADEAAPSELATAA